MKQNPIRRCSVCGKHIVKMRRLRHKFGYTLDWSKASYCSNACRQFAYRQRKKREMLYRLFGSNNDL